jgi:hypothetical protein
MDNVTVSPDEWIWGSAESAVVGIGMSQTFTFTNNGSDYVNINLNALLPVPSGFIADFSTISQLGPSRSAPWKLSYTPPEAGEVMLDFSIPCVFFTKTGHLTTDVNITVSGPVATSVLGEVSPPAIDFGKVPRFHEARKPLTIKNAGAVPLQVSDLMVTSNEQFSLLVDGTTIIPAKILIPANGSLEVDVNFTVFVEGAAAATLSFGTTDPNQPNVQIPLTGIGIAPTGPIVTHPLH